MSLIKYLFKCPYTSRSVKMLYHVVNLGINSNENDNNIGSESSQQVDTSEHRG